jgi:hypothetical protein
MSVREIVKLTEGKLKTLRGGVDIDSIRAIHDKSVGNVFLETTTVRHSTEETLEHVIDMLGGPEAVVRVQDNQGSYSHWMVRKHIAGVQSGSQGCFIFLDGCAERIWVEGKYEEDVLRQIGWADEAPDPTTE